MQRISSQRAFDSSRRRQSLVAQCLQEPLERRTLLAAVFWTGAAADGLWNTPGNWSNLQVPTLQDDVTIDLQGSFTVTITAQPALANSLALGSVVERSRARGGPRLIVSDSLTLTTGGTVMPPGSLELNAGGQINGGSLFIDAAQFDWNGGVMSGDPGANAQTLIGGGAVLNIAGAGTKQLVHRELNLNFLAEGNWSGGDIELNNSFVGNFGTLNFSGVATMRSIGGSSSFGNGAEVHQLGGTTTIDVFFNNVGVGDFTIDGTLVLSGGGINRRTLDLTGILVFAEESFSFGGTGHVFGSGTVRVVSGSHSDGSTLFGQFERLEVLNQGTQLQIRSFDVNSLAILNGAHVRYQLDPFASRVGSLEIDASSQLDISSQFFVIDYEGASPLTQIRGLLTSGYSGGTWTGPGINTSAGAALGLAIGYAESTDLFTSFPAPFGGLMVDESAVLLRITHYGDANLDATVRLDDFNRLAGNFMQTGTSWSQANFNFDDITDFADFDALADRFGQTAGARSGPDLDPTERARMLDELEELAFGDSGRAKN